jgi:hypothetical protein
MAPPTSALYPSSCASVTVASSAGGTQLIGANPQRNGLMITNRSAVIVTIAPLNPAFASVPVAGATGLGFDIAAGASIFIGQSGLGPVAIPTIPFNWTAGIQAIAASSTAVVTVMEL